MISKYGISVAILTACLSPAWGSVGTLGDPAPPLVVKEWIKGPPVDVNAGTNIYVVELWATWNRDHGGIVARLNEIQKTYKDKGLRVVGISEEPVDKLKDYVARQQPPIEYAIAEDDKRKTSLSYMLAYGQRELPHTFVIGQGGKMLWHGHPLFGLDQVLADIFAGRYRRSSSIGFSRARATPGPGKSARNSLPPAPTAWPNCASSRCLSPPITAPNAATSRSPPRRLTGRRSWRLPIPFA
jgi:hypothetical protein